MGLCVGAVQAATYYVDVDGSVIDLVGTIEMDTTGTFELNDFDLLVSSFNISASNNGADPFDFTEANASFGLGPSVDSNIAVTVTPTEIVFTSSSDATNDAATDIFLATDDLVEGVRPNVIYNNDHVRYLTHVEGAPHASGTFFFDDYGVSPFVFASDTPPAAVPLPAGAAVYLPVLLGGWGLSRCRRLSRCTRA